MNYPGGKGADGVYQAIINLMPKHRVYIEPFLGGGAVLRHKRPAAMSYGVEPNKDAYDRWSTFESESFINPRPRPKDSGNPAETIFSPARSNGKSINLRIYNTTFAGFRSQSGVHIEGLGSEALIYLDPPYLMESRSSKGKIYGEHDFSTWFEHEELLRLLLSLKCNVMISGYDHPVYNEKLSGWRKASFAGVSRGGPRVETVWMNYPEPQELHDYRYLGSNFREREQIKRQKQRWLAKLAGMPVQRRYALMAAIEEFSAELAKNSDAAGGSILPETIVKNGEARGVPDGIADNGDNRSTSPVAENGDAVPSENVSAKFLALDPIAEDGEGDDYDRAFGEKEREILARPLSLEQFKGLVEVDEGDGWWRFRVVADELDRFTYDSKTAANREEAVGEAYRYFEAIKAHGGAVNLHGVFIKHQVISLYKKKREYLYVRLAYSEFCGGWFYSFDGQLHDHGGGSFPSLSHDFCPDATTRGEAVHRAIGDLIKWDSRTEKLLRSIGSKKAAVSPETASSAIA